MMKIAAVVYFSGTGGTRRIAEEIDAQLKQCSLGTRLFPLDMAEPEYDPRRIDEAVSEADLFFLLFPVHAFDAPEPIYEWIEKTDAKNRRTIVVSVSGGGEVWPNTRVRYNTIHGLKNKRFEIIYEEMLVMPSNVLVPTKRELALYIMRIYPWKINRMLKRILAGDRQILTKKPSPKIHNWIAIQERKGAKRFAKNYFINDQCTGCGWCAKKCPRGNVRMENQRPVFGQNCMACLRCYYGCPEGAIGCRSMAAIKSGYDLEGLARESQGGGLPSIEKYKNSLLWKGVYRYIKD